MEEGDVVWARAGVLGHLSCSTPLVIPFQSAGASERTPGPTGQAQLSLNCSALAAARLQLPTFSLGVGKTNFKLDISAVVASEEAAAIRQFQFFFPSRVS